MLLLGAMVVSTACTTAPSTELSDRGGSTPEQTAAAPLAVEATSAAPATTTHAVDSTSTSIAVSSSGPTAASVDDEELFARVARRFTVRVSNRGCGTLGLGSGFLLDQTTLVTNRHVIDGAVELGIETWSGREVTASASAVARHADIAFVRLSEPAPIAVGSVPASPPVLAPFDPEPGQRIAAAGYPHGETFVLLLVTVRRSCSPLVRSSTMSAARRSAPSGAGAPHDRCGGAWELWRTASRRRGSSGGRRLCPGHRDRSESGDSPLGARDRARRC